MNLSRELKYIANRIITLRRLINQTESQYNDEISTNNITHLIEVNEYKVRLDEVNKILHTFPNENRRDVIQYVNMNI